MSEAPTRLARQLAFVAELDKLKDIRRRSLVAGSRRQENSAEHSWHLALMAMTLLEHAQEPGLDRFHVLQLLLVHDIVEIDAGDTFCYDATGNATKADRERRAADRLFNILPADQAGAMRALWDEFELGSTKESRWAQGLDRLQPVLQNLRTGGAAWQRHGVTKEEVLKINKMIAQTMPGIWELLREEIDLAEKSGAFAP